MTVKEEVDASRLIIEGRLTGLWAGEADRYWKSFLASRERTVAVVDVRGVMAIDAAGKSLLQEMHRRGVRLVTSGCLMNSVVTDITHDGRRSDRRTRRRKT